ncbi:MAG: hypothetical protein Kow0099_22280 [Candidatus Abyssubacteria bacterium]
MVEMLVVLAIIALLMVIVVPQFAFQQKGAGLKGAATELMTALRTTRREAITNRELRALALNIYSIPAEFVMMRQPRTGEPSVPSWIEVGEPHQLPKNIAIVAVMESLSGSLDAKRTDDVDLDLDDENPTSPGDPELPSNSRIFNPELDPNIPTPTHGRNVHVNPIYRLIRFWPTGTADPAVIYLWNITEGRQEIPAPTAAMALSNIDTLGVPPGLQLNNITSQTNFFTVPTANSPYDTYYYTLVVNSVTGGVRVYDYAWGDGWDRKKDGS